MYQPMRVAFRTEAGGVFGSGHLVRCLALAHELRAEADVHFIVSQASQGRELIEARGFSCSTIRVSSGELATRDTVLALRAAGASLLVTDYDGLSAPEVARIRLELPSLRVACLDDRSISPGVAHLLIRPHLVERWQLSPQPGVCLGPSYWVLRPDFDAELARVQERQVPEQVRRLLVMLGGLPPDDVLSRLMVALLDRCPELELDVVIGPLAHGLVRTEAVATQHDTRVRLHRDPARLAAMMADADLCVTGGGYSMYELAALGTPMVALAMVDHQHETTQAFASRGAASAVTSDGARAAADVATQVAALLEDPRARAALMSSGRRLVDARGRQRVASMLSKLARATDGDAQAITAGGV